MKKIICLLIVAVACVELIAQSTEISRNWTAFAQSRDASFLKKKTKFKLTASGKIVMPDSVSRAGIWVRVDNKNSEPSFFYNKDNPISAALNGIPIPLKEQWTKSRIRSFSADGAGKTANSTSTISNYL